MVRYAVLGATGDTVQSLMRNGAEKGLLVLVSSDLEPPVQTLTGLEVALVFVGLAGGDDACLASVKALAQDRPVVVLEERSDPALGRRAMASGARASLAVPVSDDDLAAVLHDAEIERHATSEFQLLDDAAEPAKRVALAAT